MAKRVSKKLLLGLGSTVTFGSVGVVVGFGLKSILDYNNQQNFLNQINRLSEASFDTAPDYNKATADMFFDTTDLKSFHFGDVQKGQTVTPYGWLGVFEQSGGISRKIALTGWNGEILWVNDDYKDQGSETKFNVYDMKYDFNTDLIFVARTNSDNGLFLSNGSSVTVIIDVLDAKTGIKKGKAEINQNNAWSFLKGKYIDPNDANHRARSKNLYSLDVISKSANDVVVTFTPNFLQLTLRQNTTQTQGQNAINRIMPLVDIADGYHSMVTNLVFTKSGDTIQINTRKFNIRDANSFQNRPSQPGWYPDWDNSNPVFDSDYLTEYFPIANPFITMKGNNFILHLLVSKKNAAKTLHKLIEFDSNGKYAGSGGIDKSENLTQRLLIYGDGTWVESKDWTNDFVNANLRINRNMFDTNSIVFAFPYAAGGVGLRLPIFNVAQFWIDSNTGLTKNWNVNNAKKSMVLPFGKEIVDYWTVNNPSYNNSSINKIYPFPDSGKGQTNLNHNYNRLIGVSPFDNTVLFAAKPNMTNDIFSQHNNNENKWANFWIGNFNRQTPYRPFMIYNDQSLSANVDSTMTNINDLYTKGLTFDLRSLTGQSLNLYFNQTGSGRNDSYSGNGFRTSKIGLLTDLLVKDSGASIWYGNVTKPTTKDLNLMGTGIDSKSYSTLIHSRANLDKWYPRTWKNSETPSNLFSANTQINFADANENTRAVARKFNSTLNDGSFFNTSRSVDLVSDWLDKDNAGPVNYQRLLVKRPVIKVRSQSLSNKLPLETTYPLAKNDFLTQNIWINSTLNDQQKKRLTFSFQEDLNSASYQVLSSWKEQVRMQSIGTTTNDLRAVENPDFRTSASWYDVRKQTINPSPFGKVNNNVVVGNNKRPLRMLLQIKKPTGTMPVWFNKIDNRWFDKYPLTKDAIKGETTFEQVLKAFGEEKTRKIDLTDDASSASVGLGNLRIEAFLDINPSAITKPDDFKIYTNGKKRMIVQNDTGLRIIYEDKYTEQWHQIYDQSQIKYNQFSQGGFGDGVKRDVQTSWAQGSMPSSTTKLKVVINALHFQDNLVRKSANQGKIFTFDYDNNRNLVITPTDEQWLRSRLWNFQRLIDMTPIFEYWTEESKTWQTLTTLNDNWFETNWPKGKNTFTIPASSVNQTITKVRLRLKPNDLVKNNDPNSFVQFENYSDTENKFISDEQTSGIQRIDVNKDWFNQITLSNQLNSLSSINAQDFQNYEDQIFQKSDAIKKKPELRTKVKLMYKWNGSGNELDKNEIANLIQTRLKDFNSADQGVFALWNGTNGIKIQAIFRTVDDTVSFNVGNNLNPTPDQLTGDVKSDIKNEINLGSYINELKSKIINAAAGNVPGEFLGTDIQFPAKSGDPGTSQFAGKTYEEIQTILNSVGVSIRYKQWENNGWSAWINDLANINKYNTSNPQIKIGFQVNNAWNIKLKNNTEDIDDTKEFTLNLNLPKLVKLPEESKVNELIQKFNEKNIFGGNTYKLIVENLDTGKEVVSNALKEASSPNGTGYDGLENYLELKFQFGHNQQWMSADDLKSSLLNQTIDQENNSLKMQILMTSNTSFIFEDQLKTKEFDLLPEDNTVIKKYVHGTKIEPELDKISASGTSTAITYTYPPEIQKIIQNKKPGLKLQYTYNQGLSPLEINNFDANADWTDVNNNGLPTSGIPAGIKKIYVRITVTDGNLYVYGPDDDGTKRKGTIDLDNLRDQINVDANWLNLPFPENVITNITDVNVKTIEDFEKSVFQNITTLTEEQKSKLSIKYFFGRNNNPLDKNALLAEFSNYRNAATFDILQLWNNHQGVKISATFDKKDTNGNYDLIWVNQNQKFQTLDTSKVITTIDLISLVQWLETIKVNVNKNGNLISSLQFPIINTSGPGPFNNKEWTKTEEALEALAIKVQYQEMTPTSDSNVWNDSLDSIKNHDNRSQFRVRFVLEKSKGKNLIVKIRTTEELIGTDQANRDSKPITVNLAIPKVIQIDNTAIDKFRNSNPFSGSTKQVKINSSSLNTLIDDIKRSNLNSQVPSINSAPLGVEFRFGTTDPFREWNEWTKYLEGMTTDQKTNQIQIKFSIPSANANEWSIEPNNGAYTILNPNNTTVPIYVHDQDIHETIKMNTTVSGTNTALDIQFPTNAGFTVNDQNQIQGSKGVGLKLQFSLDINADVNDDPKWTDTRPVSVAAGVDKIFIRIVPMSQSYVYEKQVNNVNTKIQIDLKNVIQKIRVDKTWFNEFKFADNNRIEIHDLSAEMINKWIAKVQDKIKTENNVNETIAKKVNIKFTFKGEANLTAETLFNRISSELNNFNSNELGILQLWNKIRGEKIRAEFVAQDGSISIHDATGNTTNISDDLWTDNIYTKVNLSKYVQVLENQFTSVIRSDSLSQGQMNSFTPPAMPDGSEQFSNKTYNQIAARLAAVGIKILFQQPADNAWVEKDVLKTYNPQTALLPLAFVNETDTNIELEIKADPNSNLIINPGQDNKTNPINLKLQVPKQFNISQTIVDSYKQNHGLSGNTKDIELDTFRLNKLINDLNNDNQITTSDVVVKVLFSLNPETPFVEFEQLQKILQQKDKDLTSNKVVIKFKIADDQQDKWFIENENKEYIILDNNNSFIKFFINDQGIYSDLQNTTFSGTNENLKWVFRPNIEVNETDGKLRKNLNGTTYGVGLKLAYSFNKTDWKNEQPKKYPPTQKQVFIKIQLEDTNRYVYENAEKVIELALNLPVNIHLKNEWLNQSLFNDPSKAINEFIKNANTIFTDYENKVIEAAKQGGIDQSLISKFTIKYNFDGNNDLTKDQLIEKLTNYKTDKSSTNNFGILQLWNQNNGIKIESSFADADSSDNFVIQKDSSDPFVLDTAKVETIIDFSNVVKWLTAATMKVPIEEGDTANAIKKINIPNTDGLTDDYFANRSWSDIETALGIFGIMIEYKADKLSGANWGPLNSIQTYDPTSGQIQFRLKFKNNQYTNLKLLINGQEFEGKNQAISSEYKFKLDVKLNVIVDPIKIEQFIQSAAIKGDTKNIQITQGTEENLINNIKQENALTNPEFQKLNLKIEYYLGTEKDANIVWRDWNQFQSYLAAQTTDQKSNRVIFKLTIDPSQNDIFSVANTTYVLHDDRNSPENWAVKYFINKAKLEDSASKISVSGTSSLVKWNYDSFGANNVVKETQADGLNKIFIKNIHGQKILQVFFSTKENINYNDPESDALTDITTKWVSLEPNKFLDDWNVSKLYVKLMPLTGYIYESKEEGQAASHLISLANLKLEIKVDPETLKAALNLSNGKTYLHELELKDIQTFITNAINTIKINKDKVDVQFKFRAKDNLTADQLFREIEIALNINAGKAKNIVQLWNGAAGEKIEAKFILKNDAKDQYILIDSVNDKLDANRFVLVNTNGIKTLIDLRKIVEDLSKLKIDVTLPNQTTYDLVPLDRLTMPQIPTSDNSSELQGLTWEKFEARLATFGIKIQARPKVKNGTPAEPWTSISSIKKYDSNLLLLELRFKISGQDGANIVLSVKQEADVDINTAENNLSTFKMNLNAPAQVQVNKTLIENFIKQGVFSGDTKYLNIDQNNSETTLIQGIVQENINNNPQIYQELKDRLEIQYYLGENVSSPNINWESAQGLKDFLSKQNKDQTTNKIWFRLNIKNSTSANAQIFQVDQTPKVLNEEEISSTARIKIYINETGFSADIKKLKAVGSTDNFEVNGLKEWKQRIPKGLEIGYSKENNPDETIDTQWTDQLPTQLTSDKKLWIRFKVKDGYVYQNAKTDNDRYSDKHEIDTTGIKVILKVKTEWLKKIIITGNIINAKLDENQVLKDIQDSGILPTGQGDLIQLQYNIVGTGKWWSKAEFEKELEKLQAKKDDKNFILKREELQVRFNIKPTTRVNDQYGLNIDGENIDDNNRDRYNIKLVEKNQRNDQFKGYINLDHLKDFAVENFKINGSTSKPKLIITKRKELDQLFMPYASDDLFDIQFSTEKDQNGDWVWKNNQSILKGGKLIDENGLIANGITIGAQKFFAIRFISKDTNSYEVYSQGAEQTDGKILDISNNVKITVEITNPFTAKGKTLGLWTRENNTGKYYQAEGGFKIVLANKSNFVIENNGQDSAQEFLKNTTDLTEIEKGVLELVFHVFDSNPSDQEIERVRTSITNYEDQETWKSFDTIKENGSSDWSKNLKLKVGDNVAVALRVKAEFATQTDPFVLKDDDHSMILPVMTDSNGATVKPGRLSGYKVKTDSIVLQKDNVIVSNMISSQLPPLDGWTELQRVSLQPDESDHYLGVDLKLQLYTEFHEKDGHILLSGNNTKLVKRLTNIDKPDTIEDKGNYKDKNDQNIVDKDNVEVKIYKDKNTKRLSEPKKSNNVTKEKMLSNLGAGNFKFEPEADSYERGRFSLFRNQDIDLLLVANKGEGTDTLPDFYLDQDNKKIQLREFISPQIKFPVENEKKISYAWNYDDFGPDQIKYKPSNNAPKPEEGNAQIETIYKLIKKQGTANDVEEITGDSIDEAIQNVEQKLKEDFEGQLRFETIHQTNKGNQTISKDSNIYKFKNLSNKDRIILKIVAVDEDLFYVSEEQPLVINVNGLTESAPDKNKLQYLRVKQGGLIDGQGSFKVLVSNPEKDDEDNQTILNGWKFLIRVWDKDKDEQGNWQIKIPWSDDPSQIKGLSNGDRVEWKLVSSDGNPVKDAYYNTIALEHEQKPDGTINYNFGEVNYPNGQTSYQVIKNGIGIYPDDDSKYPEKSGFVISGLESTFKIFKINQDTFELIMNELSPVYVGLNKQGTINFNSKYLEDDYWVNTKGEIYLKNENQAKLNNEVEELAEIPIMEFIDNITFFTEDPVIYPYQNGFKFSGNDVNINNHLANGDHVWAQFNMIDDFDDENKETSSNSNVSSITWQLADVTGLKNTIDPMSPLWYVLMALAAILTLGTASLIAYMIGRNKKLKGKN